MNLSELKEELKDFFPKGCRWLVDDDGQIIIYTSLYEGHDGDLISDSDDDLDDEFDFDSVCQSELDLPEEA